MCLFVLILAAVRVPIIGRRVVLLVSLSHCFGQQALCFETRTLFRPNLFLEQTALNLLLFLSLELGFLLLLEEQLFAPFLALMSGRENTWARRDKKENVSASPDKAGRSDNRCRLEENSPRAFP